MTDDMSQDESPEKDTRYWLWSYNGSDSEDYEDFEGPFDSIDEAKAAFTHGYYPYVGTIFNDGNGVCYCYNGGWVINDE